MHRALSLGLGVVALAATTAILAINIVVAVFATETTSLRIVSSVSAALTALALAIVSCLCLSQLLASLVTPLHRHAKVAATLALLLCIASGAASAAGLVLLSKARPKNLGAPSIANPGFLIGAAVALGVSSAGQVLFVIVAVIFNRAHASESSSSPQIENGERRSPKSNTKGIRYSQTLVVPAEMAEKIAADSGMPALPTSERSNTENMSISTSGSIRSSSSQTPIRSVSSKTRLLSTRDRLRPTSPETSASRPSLSDSFDSWDTSSVDAHNRQMILEVSTSSPTGLPTRSLETIPASPTVSRSPSPGSALSLEPPATQSRRSRSYSPAGRKRSSSALASYESPSELHIHPLFRSDSPTPPPMATPGTIVLASPNAGQMITHKQSLRSIKSMQRVRSGSMPSTPSPLSRQGSFEEGSSVKRSDDAQKNISEVDEERRMTPPIPDFILSAGSRTSLSDYNSRKGKAGEAD